MVDYKLKLKALFHDPIDKLLFIEQHEEIAKKLFKYLLQENLGDEKVKTADHLSSALSRIVVKPQNIADETQFEIESAVDLNEAKFIDIFSGKVEDIQSPKNHTEVEQFFQTLGNFSKQISNPDERAKFLFLFLWRFLPEIFPWIEKHPADSRAPNHSIYDHLVQTSAVVSALPEPAFLLFTISPVQEFISKARKTSDLWAGSYILSYLIYKAIEVIIEKLGPDNVIFPNLLGQPLVDRYLANLKLSDGKTTFKNFFSENFENEEWFKRFIDNAYLDEKLTIANFPNRFLAIVPYVKDNNQNFGIDLARKVETAVIKSLTDEIADKVVEVKEFNTLFEGNQLLISKVKDKVKEHLLSYFQIYWVLMPWTNDTQNYSPDDALSDYAKLISNKTETYEIVKIIKSHPYYGLANVGSAYSLLLELTEKLLGARKSIRNHIKNDYYESGGEKCRLCGEFEVLNIDWDKLAEKVANSHLIKISLEWENGKLKFKAREKLCGVCLTKRLFPEIIKDVLGLKEEIKFPSTSEMASIGEKRRLKTEIKIGKKVNSSTEVKGFADLFKEFKQNIEGKNPGRKLPETISVPKLKGDPLYEIDGQWLMEENYRKEYFDKEYGLPNVDKNEFDKILQFLKDNKINPSKYYAILMMDGDNMGKWLKGDFNPKIADAIHQKTKGALIRYSQGNDLEELLNLKHPVSPSIHQAFSRRLSKFALEKVRYIIEDKHYGKLVYAGGDDVLAFLPIEEVLDCAYEIQESFKEVLSPKASMSAGIVVVHYKYPLYLALEEVRDVEKRAKNKGKNAFCIKVLRHSGEFREFTGKWDEIKFIKELICKFKNEEISTRFAYDFAEVVNEVGKGNKEVLSVELKRLYQRKSKNQQFLEILVNKFDNYDVYDFINALIISNFLASERRI